MEKRVIVLLLVPFLLFWHWFEPAARKNQKGIGLYDQKRYEAALRLFLSAKGGKPDSGILKNNTAAALYQLGKYKEALQEFAGIKPGRRSIPDADLNYNMGNAAYRLQDWQGAVDHYKKSLLSQPDDLEAKKNYELAYAKLHQFDPDQPPPDQNQQQMEQPPQKEPLMQYLNQKDKEEQQKRKRKTESGKRERDW